MSFQLVITLLLLLINIVAWGRHHRASVNICVQNCRWPKNVPTRKRHFWQGGITIIDWNSNQPTLRRIPSHRGVSYYIVCFLPWFSGFQEIAQAFSPGGELPETSSERISLFNEKLPVGPPLTVKKTPTLSFDRVMYILPFWGLNFRGAEESLPMV